MDSENIVIGKVIKSIGSSFFLSLKDGVRIECKLRGKLRLKQDKGTNPLTIGDYVDVDMSKSDPVITAIHPRKNYIIRKSTNLSKQHHIIAANIDQAALIVTVKGPQTPTAFIDRFLVTAEAYSIKAKLILNKIDVYDEKEVNQLAELMEIYTNIGYECIPVSALKKINLDKIKDLLQNKTTLVSGLSGVGKSTLINAIDSNLDLKTAEISGYHKKGKHTTTFSEMFELEFGGYIIDTPGVKAFGLVEMNKNEIYHFFPEMFKAAEDCKFHNCIHINEPDCAVIDAVEKDEISVDRYNNYLSIYYDENTKYR
jgi:ribosome biogenesis GTPase